MNEHGHQCAVMQWCDVQKHKYPELQKLFAVPNGEKRSISVGKRLKNEGVKSGVPDLILPVARGGFHSLYIELKKSKCAKSPAGRVSPNQAKWIDALNEEGNMAVVCVGWEAATKTLESYLEMK